MFTIRDKMNRLYCEFKYVKHRLSFQREDMTENCKSKQFPFFLREFGGAFDLPVSITTLGKVKLTLWKNIPTSIQFTQTK